MVEHCRKPLESKLVIVGNLHLLLLRSLASCPLFIELLISGSFHPLLLEDTLIMLQDEFLRLITGLRRAICHLLL